MKILKVFKKNTENGYASIVETLIASIILVISVTSAGVIINSGLKIKLEADSTTKALEYTQQIITQIKTTPYSDLGIITTGGDNTNVINFSNNDTEGCTPVAATFGGQSEILSTNGLPYCQVFTPSSNAGLTFSAETHVTEYSKTLEASKTPSDISSSEDFNAKKATIIVRWFEGDLDSNGDPIMKSVRNELILTPTLDSCIPTVNNEGGECLP